MAKIADADKNKYMADGIALFGRVCAKQGNCSECAVNNVRGANITCQDFARQFPQKMLSILREMDGEETTYYSEFCMRFPQSNMPVEELANVACRKALFEGFVDCEDDSDCVACWNTPYQGDYTGAQEESEEPSEENVDASIATLLG